MRIDYSGEADDTRGLTVGYVIEVRQTNGKVYDAEFAGYQFVDGRRVAVLRDFDPDEGDAVPGSETTVPLEQIESVYVY